MAGRSAVRARRALAACLVVACGAAHAATAPSRMMANVFRLSEAGAVLAVCFASPAFDALPAEHSARLRGLAERIGKLVASIGRHYRDDDLLATYEATRARIAAEPRLRLHVKNHYGYCGERLAVEMEKYVAENEALIGAFLEKPRPRPSP